MKNRDLVKRALQIQKKIDSMSKLYKEMDEIVDKLQKSKFKAITLETGAREQTTVYLIDNFAKKNVAFRTTSVRRFELEIVSIERKKK